MAIKYFCDRCGEEQGETDDYLRCKLSVTDGYHDENRLLEDQPVKVKVAYLCLDCVDNLRAAMEATP